LRGVVFKFREAKFATLCFVGELDIANLHTRCAAFGEVEQSTIDFIRSNRGLFQ
jgi:hypothetical protein